MGRLVSGPHLLGRIGSVMRVSASVALGMVLQSARITSWGGFLGVYVERETDISPWTLPPGHFPPDSSPRGEMSYTHVELTLNRQDCGWFF